MRAHFALIGIVAGSREFSIVCASTEYSVVKAELNAARLAQDGAKYDLLQLVVVKGGDFTRKQFRATSAADWRHEAKPAKKTKTTAQTDDNK